MEESNVSDTDPDLEAGSGSRRAKKGFLTIFA
jgi:hypothetical protein